jgi:hypothetical protein
MRPRGKRPIGRLWVSLVSLSVAAAGLAGQEQQAPSVAIRTRFEKAPPSAGDLALRFETPARVKRLFLFYGDQGAWLARIVPKQEDGFRVTLYDYRAPSLTLRLYWEDEDGQGGYTAPETFQIAGGDAKAVSPLLPGAGCPVGFNLIPSTDEQEGENLRSVAELSRHGVKDLLVNFYARHYERFLKNGGLDRLLTAADQEGMRVWINTRDTEPLGQNYYPEMGLMAARDVERFAFTYVLTRSYEIKGATLKDDTGSFSSQWWLPRWSKEDVLSVRAFAYDPRAADPLPTAVEIPAVQIAWDYVVEKDRAHQPKITYEIEGLGEYPGWGLTVQIALRTLRLWTVPPVWDDAYYEEFHKPRIVQDLVTHGKLAGHPSFQGVATVNEPTLTWQGGDVFHPSVARLWAKFLEARYKSAEELSRAFGQGFTRFEEVPLLPRLVFRGAVHTAWSGAPGKPGLTSEYEVARSLFRERLMNLVYQRTNAAFAQALPGKDGFVKFQASGPSSYYGLEVQQADSAVRLPEITVMASDFYPIGHLEAGTPLPPGVAAPRFLGDASYGVLLGHGQSKPVWVAETSFGRGREFPAVTAATTRLTLDLLFSSGVQRAFVWAVVPSGWRARQDLYYTGGETWEERTCPALESLFEFVWENAERHARAPDYDLVVLAPRTDAMLYGANRDQDLSGRMSGLTRALIGQGFLAAQGALTPEACRQARAVVLLGGYYLSEDELKLLRALDRPLLVLGPPYPLNPVDGTPLRVRKDSRTFKEGEEGLGVYQVKTVPVAGGPAVKVKRTFAFRVPKEAQVLGEDRGFSRGETVTTHFRAGSRTTFAYEADSGADAALFVAHWFRQTRPERKP